MRILQVVGWLDPAFGGPPKVCVGQAIALAQLGHEVTIVSTNTGSESVVNSEGLRNAGVSVHTFQTRWPHKLRDAPALAGFLENKLIDHDVVHIHCVWERCLARVAKSARKLGIPYVVAPHGMIDLWSMRRPLRYKKDIIGGLLGNWKMLTGASAVQFGSKDESTEARMVGLGGNHVIIPNGVHPERPTESVIEDVRCDLFVRFPSLREPGSVVVFFGRFHPKKGVDMLLRAFARVWQEYPDCRILCVGIAEDASYLRKLRAIVTESGLASRVFMTTDLVGPNAVAALSLGTIYAHPAHQEGFSTSILDAMRMSLPLLLTDRCRMQETELKRAGQVVEATDAGIEIGLRGMLSNSFEQLNEMGRSAHDWMLAEFTWEAVSRKLVTLYVDLIRSKVTEGKL